MSARTAIAAGATIAYVLFAALVFGTELVAGPDQPVLVFVYFVALHVGVGVLVGRWWAVLLPILPAAMPFLPFAPEQWEGPFVQLQAFAAVIMGALVAAGVGVRRLAATITS